MKPNHEPRHVDFIAGTTWAGLPDDVRNRARTCLRDILATAAASPVIQAEANAKLETCLRQFAPGRAPVWFSGTSLGVLGAAFANAFRVDSVDWHDGFRPTRGHAGATVVPAVISAAAEHASSGREMMTALVIGYEIGCRAGLLSHATYAPHYHASGSWVALGAAAGMARLAGLGAEGIDGALGLAEYHAPISPMMRCIDSPCCLKDAAAGGALAAVQGVVLSQSGLRGLPSLFMQGEGGEDEVLGSLGERWLILEQYFKPYPTCRWSHSAVEAVAALRQAHALRAHEVEKVIVHTHRDGSRLRNTPPADSDGAQYSTPWAVATVLVHGSLGPGQVAAPALGDPEVTEVSRRFELRVDAELDARYPAENLARVTLMLTDGRVLESPVSDARGGPHNPMTEEQLSGKFEAALDEAVGRDAREQIAGVIDTLDARPARDLTRLLARPAQR